MARTEYVQYDKPYIVASSWLSRIERQSLYSSMSLTKVSIKQMVQQNKYEKPI